MRTFNQHHALLLAAALAAPLSASALDLRVTTFADEYDGHCTPQHCSLRDAVSAANAAGQARILLAAGDYLIERGTDGGSVEAPAEEDDNLTGDFDIHASVTVVGQGAEATRIDGRQMDRLFHVHPGSQLSLRDLTLTRGLQALDGGALLNQGTLRLHQVALRSNRILVDAPYPAELAGAGGGIANLGTLVVTRSTFSGNSVYAGESTRMGLGGAIYNEGILTIRDSLFEYNMAYDWHEMGMGGALFNKGAADVARTTFHANNVSYSGLGAAIHNVYDLKLVNSTLSGNRGAAKRAAFDNGDLWRPEVSAQSRAYLAHVTIVDNDAWGVINRGQLYLRNSIIAGNASSEFEGEIRNCHNLPTAIGFQARGLMLGGGSIGCTGSVLTSDASLLSRQLFPLQANNGSLVHPLRRGSAAIDAGVGTCASHDQRGLDRLRDGNGDGIVNCDLGAFERAHP